MFLVLNVRDLSPNEVIAQMTYWCRMQGLNLRHLPCKDSALPTELILHNGRQDRIRTYSPKGNGFTVRRDSPTSPLADNKEATYTELPQQPPTIVWTRKGKCIYDALVILLGLEPRLFAVKGRCVSLLHYSTIYQAQ